MPSGEHLVEVPSCQHPECPNPIPVAVKRSRTMSFWKNSGAAAWVWSTKRRPRYSDSARSQDRVREGATRVRDANRVSRNKYPAFRLEPPWDSSSIVGQPEAVRLLPRNRLHATPPSIGSEYRATHAAGVRSGRRRREIGKPGENRGKVIAHRDLRPTAAFHDRENRCNLRSRLWAAGVDRVLPTKSHRTHGILRKVIAQLKFRIFQKSRE